MFLPNSRYANQKTLTVPGPKGRPVQALSRRVLPAAAGGVFEIKTNDQLDLLALQQLGDGTKPWAIADANTALEANSLLKKVGDTLLLPNQG
jgi:hypothetical protein